MAVLWLFSAAATGDCDFDTDDADSPDFMAKILACEKNAKPPSNKDQKPSAAQTPATKLYGDGTVDPVSGMADQMKEQDHPAGEVRLNYVVLHTCSCCVD